MILQLGAFGINGMLKCPVNGVSSSYSGTTRVCSLCLIVSQRAIVHVHMRTYVLDCGQATVYLTIKKLLTLPKLKSHLKS